MTPRIGRLSTPYMRERPIIDVGYSLVVWSPLENEERQVLRLIEDALEAANLRRRLRDRDQRESLLDVIHNRNLWTAFQTIVEIDSRKIMGCEGLSRGPRGSDVEYPTMLFGRAARYGLTEELERVVPQADLHGLGGLRRDRAALREHRARHHSRLELPGPGRARLPRAQALAPLRDPRDHRAAGDREPEPLPRGHARLHRPRLLLRHRRPGRRLLGPRDGGRAPAELPEDRHGAWCATCTRRRSISRW